MIWLLLNGWWLLLVVLALPVLVALLTGLWPALVALVRGIPDRVLAALVATAVVVLAVSLASGWLVRVGEDRCRAAQEATEKRLDAKAERVAKDSHAQAQKARDTIRKGSDDVQTRIREVVRTVPGGCPAMPPELRDLLQREVEAARAELPPAAGGRDP